MSCSLKDIAEDLKLSKTTVSWVLSGNGNRRNISIETQELVKKRAREMNYEPNLLAKSLSKGITHTLGLIIPSISDLFYAQIAKAIELEAWKNNFSVIFCSSESDPQKEFDLIRMLKQKQVDGLIIAPTKKNDNQIKQLIVEKYPFVLFDRYYPNLNTNYVIINNEESAYNVVKRVIAEGRRKIAIITTNSYLLLMKMRYNGYKKALEEAGIKVDENLLIEVNVTDYENELNKVLYELLSHYPDIDGFFFTTHILAIETIKYLYKHFDNVTKRFGFACMHEEPLLHVLAPNLKIARMPVQEIGQMAASILIEEITMKQEGIIKESEKVGIVLKSTIIE
ncbi:MAG TPA: LacI family transcriptional regulator [Porphyromonadaceae bacterium]|jgi:LacI family transcriptional regulator|nr:LacI family transcriptional regulator [Porphyromonadaceae bacterium]HBL33786.1 LacI family transcriptional regulator [Porphyromonadaceae bacterium]HBX20004.1 LacI family transcriptional regulator [Porphyromonadaceae bacterium]HCM22251.1 LacI family transcriptional regulator [Porphyromonadaceae bacterium]